MSQANERSSTLSTKAGHPTTNAMSGPLIKVPAAKETQNNIAPSNVIGLPR